MKNKGDKKKEGEEGEEKEGRRNVFLVSTLKTSLWFTPPKFKPFYLLIYTVNKSLHTRYFGSTNGTNGP
jgi:hypothetical protein